MTCFTLFCIRWHLASLLSVIVPSLLYWNFSNKVSRYLLHLAHVLSRTLTLGLLILPSVFGLLLQGSPPCNFYTRYGICKFGPTCKFDHPLRGLTYGSPASLQTDIPVGGPYPSGSLLTVLTPSSSSEVPQEVSNTASPSDEPASEEVSGCIPLRAIPDSAVMRTMAASNLLAQGTRSETAINSPATEILDAS